MSSWHVAEPGVRHEAYCAPTWSWASVVSASGQPPRAKNAWNGQSASKEALQESNVETLGVSGPELAIVGDSNIPELAMLHFRAPLISAELAIETFEKPEIDYEMQGYGFMLYESPARDFRHSVSKNGQTCRFMADLLLHVGPHSLKSGSQIHLMYAARRFGQQKPDNILVLKQLDTGADFINYVRFGIVSRTTDMKAYARIGVINRFREEDLNNWYDDAELEQAVLF